MAASVSVAHEGAVVWVTLDHPGKFNAMSRSMWVALRSAFVALQADTRVRCVVVRGQGGHFCAGGDIAQYPKFRFDPAQLRHFHETEVWGALQAMLDCDVPIVAQLEGNCMGAGVEIASCCDLRIASDSSRFGAPIARLGFPMAPREAALVAGAVGATTARAMLLAAEVFDAAHMQACGFLTRTVPGELAAQACSETAQRIAALAPQTARLNKQTLRAISGRNTDLALVECTQDATENIAAGSIHVTDSDPYAYADSAEHREGIAAFLDKRPPQF
jgi:enoyl-CoA hydratase/carnithine racemase